MNVRNLLQTFTNAIVILRVRKKVIYRVILIRNHLSDINAINFYGFVHTFNFIT